jgi:hypothetical protein
VLLLSAAAGTAAEMVTPGGELAFVRAMIADSRRLRGRVHWYSSMCGKKASMKVLRQELHSAGVLLGVGWVCGRSIIIIIIIISSSSSSSSSSCMGGHL